jgi:tricorn protease
MQFAFRGHMVVLVDEYTASDGELFAEGFRRLGLGRVIGTRTWGGEIWLTSSNVLVDKGIATAAEFAIFGPEGQWLIEGRGVEPDVVVDNLPRATFDGGDAQLRAAVEHLERLIREQPIAPPVPPAYLDKSDATNRTRRPKSIRAPLSSRGAPAPRTPGHERAGFRRHALRALSAEEP